MPTAQKLRLLLGPLELIHEQAGPGLLRLTRLGIFGLWMMKLLLDPLWRLARFPRELFIPTGLITQAPTALLTAPALVVFWITLQLVLIGCLTNRAFPFFPRWRRCC